MSEATSGNFAAPATVRVTDCRGGGRLDELIGERDALRKRVAELEATLVPFAEEWRQVRAAFLANTNGREPDAHAYRGFCLLHATAADLALAAATIATKPADPAA